MLKKITEITNSIPLGMPPNSKLFRLSDPPYSGRKIALFKTSDTEIVYTIADAPYTAWSDPVTIASDSSNAPIDAVMDNSGTIHLVYAEQTTDYLCSIKLSHTDGDWSIGSKVYIHNLGYCTTPSITIDSSDTLWIAWAYWNISSIELHVKNSTDSGQTWGSGPADDGDILLSGVGSAIPKLIYNNSTIYLIYTEDLGHLRLQTRALSGGTWSDPYTVIENSPVDHHFDAAVLPDGFLAIVYDADALYYREFNGSNWGAVTELDSRPCTYPQLQLIDNFPVVVYLADNDNGSSDIYYQHRQSGSFSGPLRLDNRFGNFSTVLLYDTVSQTYSDLTTAASDNNSSDIFHPESTCLLAQTGDKIYLGAGQSFRSLSVELSTPGTGGTVSFSYYDGSNWRAFIPQSGSFNFTTVSKKLLLWSDYQSIPDNWQPSVINNISNYWVKIEVTAPYTTPPVGSQLTGFIPLTGLNLRR